MVLLPSSTYSCFIPAYKVPIHSTYKYDPSAWLFPISFDKCDSNFDKTTRTQEAHNSFSEMKFEVTKAKNL